MQHKLAARLNLALLREYQFETCSTKTVRETQFLQLAWLCFINTDSFTKAVNFNKMTTIIFELCLRNTKTPEAKQRLSVNFFHGITDPFNQM
jgi:hypothetical protein